MTQDSGGTAQVHTVGLTTAQMRELSSRPGVRGFETRYHTDRYFKPWPVKTVINYKCMLRGWFEKDFLDFLPEASDAQLRRLMWEERVEGNEKVQFFWEHMISHTQGATCRHMVAPLFRDSIRMLHKYVQLKQAAPDEPLAVRTALNAWVTKEGINYSSRDFGQIVSMDEVRMADTVSDELRATLAARREADERPGAGLLTRTVEEAKKAQAKWLEASIAAST